MENTGKIYGYNNSNQRGEQPSGQLLRRSVNPIGAAQTFQDLAAAWPGGGVMDGEIEDGASGSAATNRACFAIKLRSLSRGGRNYRSWWSWPNLQLVPPT